MASLGSRTPMVRAHYYFSESPAFTGEHTDDHGKTKKSR